MIQIQTVFIIIVIISVSLGFAILLVSPTEPESGLKQLSYAMLLHGFAYSIILLFPWLGSAIFLPAQVLIALFFTFSMRAISLFHRKKEQKIIYFLPAVLIAFSTVIFIDNTDGRIIYNSMVLICVDLYVLRIMVVERKRTHGKGQYLVDFAVILNLVVLFCREYFSLTGKSHIQHISDSTLSQSLLYLSALTGLIFLAIGFVLMTKERTDHLHREMILKDKLTGVWNRRKLDEVGHAELLRLVRYGTPSSLMIIDIDDFKAINDTFGHATGDTILCLVADVCGQSIRETDILGRWGGEEFIIILPGAGVDESLQVAERVRVAINTLETGLDRRVSISIGLSLGLSSDDWHQWFERADAALYRAKSSGKNCSFFDISLQQENGISQISWNPADILGIPAVDEDHRNLIVMANDFLTFSVTNYDKRQAYARLKQIELKIQQHSRREEALLQELVPDGGALHREMHRLLENRMRFLMEKFRHDQIPLHAVVQFVVFELCAQHIALHDKEAFSVRNFSARPASSHLQSFRY